MPHYIRAYAPGGSCFLAVTLLERRRRLLTEHIDALRAAFVSVRHQRLFRIDTIVALPDHLHCLWTLPPDDANDFRRRGLIEKHFTQCAARASGQALEFADATGSILANSSFNRCSTCHRS